jgi:flavin-dependent dehydrogenase
MKSIKILGAGISGLTAAINFAKEDYDVEVHEKLSDVGKNHKLNFEGLENWTVDIMKLLKKINIKTNFRKKGFNQVTWYSPSFKEANLRDKKPFFYLVERGGKNSLEYSLKKQALDVGVRFKFNSKINNADIISTGPKKPMALAFGTFYENVNLEDKTIGILSNKIAQNGYFYILVWNRKASLCNILFSNDKFSSIRRLHRNSLKIDLCKKILNGAKIKHEFSGFANFKVPKTAVIDRRIYTGEAAGFQDALFGFGMKYAFLSGYFAAKSIINKTSYDKLWKKSFKNELKKTLCIRFILDMFGDRLHEKMISHLNSKKEYKSKLKKTYHYYNWKYNLLYHISKIIMRC